MLRQPAPPAFGFDRLRFSLRGIQMKRVISSLLTACLLATLVLSSETSAAGGGDGKKKASELIVGKWRLAEKGKKAEVTLDFKKDGKINVSMAMGEKKVEVAGKYKLKGETTLVVDLDFGDGEIKSETLKITVTEDELTTVDKKDKKEVFKRVKSSS
jgi:uncharacterized protein (TIGR03066 family)